MNPVPWQLFTLVFVAHALILYLGTYLARNFSEQRPLAERERDADRALHEADPDLAKEIGAA